MKTITFHIYYSYVLAHVLDETLSFHTLEQNTHQTKKLLCWWYFRHITKTILRIWHDLQPKYACTTYTYHEIPDSSLKNWLILGEAKIKTYTRHHSHWSLSYIGSMYIFAYTFYTVIRDGGAKQRQTTVWDTHWTNDSITAFIFFSSVF